MHSDPKAIKSFCEYYRSIATDRGRNTNANDLYMALKKGNLPHISTVVINIRWWAWAGVPINGLFDTDAEEMAKNYIESFQKK